MSPAALFRASFGFQPQSGRTPEGASCRDATPARTSETARSIRSRTARHPISFGIPPRCHRRNALRSCRHALASDARPEPRGRIRSAGRCWPAAAKHYRPAASPPPLVSVSHPPARRRSAISGRAALRAGPQSDARGTSPAIREKWFRKSCLCPHRAPSPPFSSAEPCKAHPEHDAGCALAGTRTRIRESPFRRWHSSLRPPHAVRLYLPAP